MVKKIIIAMLIIVMALGCLCSCASPEDYYDNDELIVGIQQGVSKHFYAENNLKEDGLYIKNANCDEFTGCEKIYSKLKINSENLVDIRLVVYSGRFKIVFVKDNEIAKVIEGTTEIDDSDLGLDGIYEVKFVGDHAEFEIQMITTNNK